MISRTPAALAALACWLPALGAAQTASSPVGVSVKVPPGFHLANEERPRDTTVLYMVEDVTAGAQAPAVINVDHIGPIQLSEEALFEQMRSAFQAVAPDGFESEVVQLPSGRYLRSDFDLEAGEPPRLIRKRYYVTLRDGHVYQLILSVEKDRFDQYLRAFDAMLGSTVLTDPRPNASPAPSPSASPQPSATPDAPRPSPSASPQPSATPATPRPSPSASPQPSASATPRPSPSASPQPSATPATPRPSPSASPQPSATPRPTQRPTPEPPQPSATPQPSQRPAASPPGAAGDHALAGATVVLASSEYDPDYWAAAHLLDGRPDRGWCSSPGARTPHRIVFALAQPTRLAQLAFDNDCPAEAGFEGVATKRFKVEVSALGPERGFKQIAAGELAEGKNDQRFPADSGVPVRWLRLTILNNHGHPTLTELMELRAFAADDAEPLSTGGSFRLERVRASEAKNGEAIADDATVAPEQRVWINFKPQGLATNPDGKYWLEVDLVLEDDAANVLLRRNKVVDKLSRLPSPPLSAFVALHLDLPEGFPAGDYVVRLVARDRFGERSAAAACGFTVREEE